MEQFNILVGLQRYNAQLETNVRNMLTIMYGGEDRVNILFVYSATEYEDAIQHGVTVFHATVIIEDLSAGFIHCISTFKRKYNSEHYVIVIPDKLRATSHLERLISSEIYNGLYQSQCVPKEIRALLEHERTRLEAVTYYDVENFLRGECNPDSYDLEVIQKKMGLEDVEKTEIVRDKNGNAVMKIHRILSSGAEKKKYESMVDDVIGALVDDDIDVALEDAGMSTYHLAERTDISPKVISVVKDIKNFFESEKGAHIANGIRLGSISEEYLKLYLAKTQMPSWMALTEEDRVLCLKEVKKMFEGYEVITPYIDDENVSDIRILSPSDVNVKVNGVWYKTELVFRDELSYGRFMNKISSINKGAISRSDAQGLFTDSKTHPDYKLRISMTHEMLQANEHATVHIRKIDKKKKSFEKLLGENLFKIQEIKLLIKAVRDGKSIIIGGASGSGKTILLNMLIEYLNANVCGVVVQEADEIFSNTKRNITFQHPVVGKGDSEIEFSLAKMAESALLQNTEFFCIGEIKGDEAQHFFSACNTGAQAFSTTHAKTVFEIIPRIADLADKANSQSGSDTETSVLKLLSRSVDYVVHMENYHINQIARVAGWDDERREVIYDVYEMLA